MGFTLVQKMGQEHAPRSDRGVYKSPQLLPAAHDVDRYGQHADETAE